jgi:hypothetical protein
MQYTVEQYKAWGAQGGKKRGRKLSKKRRAEIARAAARARLAKRANGGLPPA